MRRERRGEKKKIRGGIGLDEKRREERKRYEKRKDEMG